jgi:hypothetical protein
MKNPAMKQRFNWSKVNFLMPKKMNKRVQEDFEDELKEILIELYFIADDIIKDIFSRDQTKSLENVSAKALEEEKN